jgi:hypothetical protein
MRRLSDQLLGSGGHISPANSGSPTAGLGPEVDDLLAAAAAVAKQQQQAAAAAAAAAGLCAPDTDGCCPTLPGGAAGLAGGAALGAAIGALGGGMGAGHLDEAPRKLAVLGLPWETK